MDDPETRISQALRKDYKEWIVPTLPAEKFEVGNSPVGSNEERLGIACLNVFLLSLASDSRLPSAADLSALVANLFAFAQSQRLTMLAIITEFESIPGSEDYVRELLLWPLTKQAASKIVAFRTVDDDLYFFRNRHLKAFHGSKLGLLPWDDSTYDNDHILDRKVPLKKARMSNSSAFSEDTFGEESTWRRVWNIDRKGTDRDRLANCLINLLTE